MKRTRQDPAAAAPADVGAAGVAGIDSVVDVDSDNDNDNDSPRVSAPGAAGPADGTDAADGMALGEASVRVLRRFRLVFNAVKAHFQQVEKLAGVGGAQLWALSVIAATPGLGVTRLANEMDVHQSTASNLVRSLVERGLIRAAREGADRRAVQLRLLPAGRRVLRQAPAPLAGVLPQALERLDQQTLARLDADLARLITVLDTDRRHANIPLGHR